MISDNIKYSFNQFETALVAFCGNIQLKLQNIIPNLPVFIQNTGDFSYYVNKKFVETSNEEIYQKIPRLVFKIDDFQLNSQEDTNQYNKIVYCFDDGKGPRNYQAVVRRKAYNVIISANFVSSNFISALNNMEIMETLMSRDNVFTYEFLGNTIQSAYTITQSSTEFPTIDMGQGGTRNVGINYQIELQVHIIVPRVESIQLYDEIGFDSVRYDMNIVNEKSDKLNDDTVEIKDSEEFKAKGYNYSHGNFIPK